MPCKISSNAITFDSNESQEAFSHELFTIMNKIKDINIMLSDDDEDENNNREEAKLQSFDSSSDNSDDDKDFFNNNEDDGRYCDFSDDYNEAYIRRRALCEGEDEAAEAALRNKYNFSGAFFDDDDDNENYYYNLSNGKRTNKNSGLIYFF
ncbi:hypothetical protein Glove_242g101 [Diversispora epigaea]|uniref:Uncharacterized protein n=1 Tax=Diversispora epigaea TaxID=1348612 RepID=A0A397ICG5_9GLOM|nr:hypothetical protein Glove_242g101 [Diversispora epigaea]